MNRHPTEPCHLKQSIEIGLLEREGISSIDVPSPENRVARPFVDDSPVGQVGSALSLDLPLCFYAVAVEPELDAGVPGERQESREENGIAALTQDQVRIGSLDQAIEFVDGLRAGGEVKNALLMLPGDNNSTLRRQRLHPLALHFEDRERRQGMVNVVRRVFRGDLADVIMVVDRAFEAAKGKEAAHVEIVLRRRDLEIEERKLFIERSCDLTKTRKIRRVADIELQGFNLTAAPEFAPNDPAAAGNKTTAIEICGEPLQVIPGAADVYRWAEFVCEPVEPSLVVIYPERHTGTQFIDIK
ncbi:MAG TPA: hypothetical protein VJ302_10950 [Blastocatellia bacterium]|nr:hypothetical protein [Blastocatellia bacterium]